MNVGEWIEDLKEFDPKADVNFEWNGNYVEAFDIIPAKEMKEQDRINMGYKETDIVVYLE